MKKQILILVLAIFAIGFSSTAFAQHDPPTCAGDPTTPAIGILYTYQVEVPTAGGYNGTGNYTWYVTQNTALFDGPSIIDPPVDFLASGAGAYNTAIAGADEIEITWQASALVNGNPYYLVVKYEQLNSNSGTPGCITNNVKVYRVFPRNTFWLAIDNVTTEQCAAEVFSATITEPTPPATNAEVVYIYGENTIEITVTAGGYTGDWAAQLQLGGFNEEQTLTVNWAATVAATGGTFTSPGTMNGIWTATLPSSTTYNNEVPPVATNETITITIVVDNNNFENLDGQTLALAIDGSFTSGSNTFNDLSDVNGACTPESPFADAVTQTIFARPTINPINPATFVDDPTTVTP